MYAYIERESSGQPYSLIGSDKSQCKLNHTEICPQWSVEELSTLWHLSHLFTGDVIFFLRVAWLSYRVCKQSYKVYKLKQGWTLCSLANTMYSILYSHIKIASILIYGNYTRKDFCLNRWWMSQSWHSIALHVGFIVAQYTKEIAIEPCWLPAVGRSFFQPFWRLLNARTCAEQDYLPWRWAFVKCQQSPCN